MALRRDAGPGWIEEAKGVPVARLAPSLGYTVKGRSLFPCPACREERRSRSDPRPPAEITTNGLGWKCYRCDATGDGLTLAAWDVAGGELAPGDPRWREVRARLADLGFCTAEGEPDGSRPARPRPVPVPAPVVAPTPDPGPLRPPAAEVADLWRESWPVLCDDEVTAWLEGRRIDSARVEWCALARALPVEAPLPPWARFGRRWAWPELGHRLIVPLWTERGELASMIARCILPNPPAIGTKDNGDPIKPPKGLPPWRPRPEGEPGFERRGLVMADALGLAMLRTGRPPPWWPSGEPFRVVVEEGEPDFLAGAVAWGVDGTAGTLGAAVLGVVAGSWTAEIAARVPSGALVAVRTDNDKQGDKYADAVFETLQGRCTVRRRLARNVDDG